MPRARELDVDIAFALEALACHATAYALDPPSPGHPDALLFAVALRPYDIDRVVEAHYALLAVTHYETTGRVLYVSADAPMSPAVARAERIVLTAAERDAARSRSALRAEDTRWLWRLEADAVRRAEAEREFARRHGEQSAMPIAASLESGQFEVVPDPFPAPPREAARVLVIDEDESTAVALRECEELTVVAARDVWSMLEALDGAAGDAGHCGDGGDDGARENTFDLVVCALRVGDVSGSEALRMAVRVRPELGARFVFMAPASAVALAPESARAGMVERPVTAAAARAILRKRRERDAAR